jgi:hypothetical protein
VHVVTSLPLEAVVGMLSANRKLSRNGLLGSLTATTNNQTAHFASTWPIRVRRRWLTTRYLPQVFGEAAVCRIFAEMPGELIFTYLL